MQQVNGSILEDEPTTVARAFGKQSLHFDADDRANPILQAWRKQIYEHARHYLQPGAHVLELNAGTGIDAHYFALQGYHVHATDISSGMIQQIDRKIDTHRLAGFTSQQVSFDRLNHVKEGPFDYVFSNFGGLNCIRDLSHVTQNLPPLLRPGAYVTWVVMPPISPWEWLWLLKGNWREATRRFQRGGTIAHLEGEYFQTYYHSVSSMKAALGNSFRLVRTEGLGVFAAPPASTNFYEQHQRLYQVLRKVDLVLKDYYPFNRWGDHVIATFQKTK